MSGSIRSLTCGRNKLGVDVGYKSQVTEAAEILWSHTGAGQCFSLALCQVLLHAWQHRVSAPSPRQDSPMPHNASFGELKDPTGCMGCGCGQSTSFGKRKNKKEKRHSLKERKKRRVANMCLQRVADQTTLIRATPCATPAPLPTRRRQ